MNKPVSSLTGQLHQKSAKIRKKHKDATALASATAAPPPPNDLLPDLLIVKRKISDLKPAKRRVRKTTPEQLNRIIASIKAYGIVVPILIDADNRIVHGHIVVKGAQALGLAEIPCIPITHLSDARIKALAIALNRIGETGEWELEELHLELADLTALNLEFPTIDMSALGFAEQEIDTILDSPAEEEEEEDLEPPAGAKPVTMPGDLFLLGKHSLLCGDSLAPESYDLLLAGKRADCVFSDSPYNCKIKGFVSGLGKTVHEDFAMAVGEMDDAQFMDFLAGYLSLCRDHMVDGAVLFACMDWRQIRLLHIAGEVAELDLLNMAVWNKGSGGMGSLYRSAYELISVFCKGKQPATNNVQLGKYGRDRTNMWTCPGANRKGSSAAGALKDHPTPKPVRLVSDALLDVTHAGDLVLDPFMGSGTTLIAAEKAGRIAHGIELEPKYVDVAIRRWEKATGKAAIHAETGKTFAQLAIERQAQQPD